MIHKVIAIDQSTSATKAMLFEDRCLINRANIEHHQYYPRTGWVEHDLVEIYENTVKAIKMLMNRVDKPDATWSLAITNQRETVVVWNRITGQPVHNAIVWQCQRGAELCRQLKLVGHEATVRAKSSLMKSDAKRLGVRPYDN